MASILSPRLELEPIPYDAHDHEDTEVPDQDLEDELNRALQEDAEFLARYTSAISLEQPPDTNPHSAPTNPNPEDYMYSEDNFPMPLPIIPVDKPEQPALPSPVASPLRETAPPIASYRHTLATASDSVKPRVSFGNTTVYYHPSNARSAVPPSALQPMLNSSLPLQRKYERLLQEEYLSKETESHDDRASQSTHATLEPIIQSAATHHKPQETIYNYTELVSLKELPTTTTASSSAIAKRRKSNKSFKPSLPPAPLSTATDEPAQQHGHDVSTSPTETRPQSTSARRRNQPDSLSLSVRTNSLPPPKFADWLRCIGDLEPEVLVTGSLAPPSLGMHDGPFSYTPNGSLAAVVRFM